MTQEKDEGRVKKRERIRRNKKDPGRDSGIKEGRKTRTYSHFHVNWLRSKASTGNGIIREHGVVKDVDDQV